MQRLRDVVAGRGHAVVEGHLDVQRHGLADLALPVVDADDRVDAQVFDENCVHSLQALTSGSVAMSQRAATFTSAFSCCPAPRRNPPPKAIIPPLSGQGGGRGNPTRPPLFPASACSFARGRRFAPTPPATTRVSLPAASSA